MVYTVIPKNINEQMRGLASELMGLEDRIACGKECGTASRLEYDKDAPVYEEVLSDTNEKRQK